MKHKRAKRNVDMDRLWRIMSRLDPKQRLELLRLDQDARASAEERQIRTQYKYLEWSPTVGRTKPPTLTLKSPWLPIGEPLDANPEFVPVVNLPLVTEKRDGYTRTFGELMAFGDVHIGHEDFSAAQFKRFLACLLGERHMVGGFMGDLNDFTVFRQRFLGGNLMARQQLDLSGQYISPVAKKIAWAIPGNHEKRVDEQMNGAFDWWPAFWSATGSHAFCARPDRGLLVMVRAGKQQYSVYAAHLISGAFINEFLALQRAQRAWMADAILSGHVHRSGERDLTYFAASPVNGGFFKQSYRTKLILTGCFLKYPAYGEVKAYPPTDVGAPIIRFSADRHHISVMDARETYFQYFDEAAPKYELDEKFSFSEKLPWRMARKEWKLKEEKKN